MGPACTTTRFGSRQALLLLSVATTSLADWVAVNSVPMSISSNKQNSVASGRLMYITASAPSPSGCSLTGCMFMKYDSAADTWTSGNAPKWDCRVWV